jgi:hypothetical protein
VKEETRKIAGAQARSKIIRLRLLYRWQYPLEEDYPQDGQNEQRLNV